MSTIFQKISSVFFDPKSPTNAPEDLTEEEILNDEGAPGAVIVDGYLQDDEKNAAVAGPLKYITYSNMLANTLIVAAGVRYFLNLVSKAEWKVQPANESEEAKEHAARITGMMKNLETPWPRVVRRAAMYRFYGFSLQEWIAIATPEGYYIVDIDPRPQQTITKWNRGHRGKIESVVQEDPATSEEMTLQRWKLIYVVDDSINDSPEGVGLFRHITKACQRLARYEQLEGYGFESDLRGVPVGRAPFASLRQAVESGLITKEQRDMAVTPLRKFITNHIKNPSLGILLDSKPYLATDDAATPSQMRQWDVSLLKGSPTSLPDMAKAIERVNREIARVLGVEGLLLGEQTTGSHALSKDKSRNISLIADSTLQELAVTFQQDFIKRLYQINGWDLDLMPSFDTDSLQFRDATEIATAIKELAEAGAPLDPNDPATDEIRGLFGLSPQPKLDEATVAQRRANGTRRPTAVTQEDLA
ncbi:hypothetical protein S0112_065 [Shewanella phage S0112]|nr:hypothetical protein S0112_065 [Shewanella phage S0112]